MEAREFELRVANTWLREILPRIIEQGGDERMMLQVVETIVVGTLFTVREQFKVDPEKAFELMKKAVDRRIADMAEKHMPEGAVIQ